MTTITVDRAVLEQVLEALVTAEAGLADIGDADREQGDDVAWCEARAAAALEGPRAAITALRDALAQPLPDPVDEYRKGFIDGQIDMRDRPEEQEPVAWIHKLHYLLGHAENMPPADRALALGWEPLHTTPPRREWQSLTNEEIYPLYNEPRSDAEMLEFARAVEAKLKEKNIG